MDVLFSQKTAKQMTFEDKICFLLCTSPQEEQVNFRYNLNAFFSSLLFYYICSIIYYLLTEMINTVFSESFSRFLF